MDLGFDAVGVPMAGQCREMLTGLLKDRHGVIVSDNDEAGSKGSEKLSSQLISTCTSVRIITPPGGAKDARQAVINGATAQDFTDLATQAVSIPIPPPEDGPTPVGPSRFAPFPVLCSPSRSCPMSSMEQRPSGVMRLSLRSPCSRPLHRQSATRTNCNSNAHGRAGDSLDRDRGRIWNNQKPGSGVGIVRGSQTPAPGNEGTRRGDQGLGSGLCPMGSRAFCMEANCHESGQDKHTTF